MSLSDSINDNSDSFIDFFPDFNLRNEATSIKNFQKILSSSNLKLAKKYSRDETFTSDVGIVKLHPSQVVIGYYIFTKSILILMVIHNLTNFLNLLGTEMVSVCNLKTQNNVRRMNEVLIVQIKVYVKFTRQKS